MVFMGMQEKLEAIKLKRCEFYGFDKKREPKVKYMGSECVIFGDGKGEVNLIVSGVLGINVREFEDAVWVILYEHGLEITNMVVKRDVLSKDGMYVSFGFRYREQ
jgi:hypothetical protein